MELSEFDCYCKSVLIVWQLRSQNECCKHSAKHYPKRGEIEKINLRLQKLLDAFLDGVIERNDYTAEKAKLMSQKKSLEEQCLALLRGRADWLGLSKVGF